MKESKMIKNNIKLILILIFVTLVSIICIKLVNSNESKLQNNNEKIALIKSEDILEDISSDEFCVKIRFSDYTVKSLLIEDIYYLFVPRSLDISDLKIKYNFDIKKTTSGKINSELKIVTNNFTKSETITLIGNDNTKYKIKVMQSDVPSLCINLEEATLKEVNEGNKDIKYQANLQIVGAEEKYNINETIELKGRGNTTWKLDKKPYQIKFEDEENLLGINGKAQKWVLLANHMDDTLLKNQLTFDLQREMGLSNSLSGSFIDLYINGEFLGNYNVCDKVDIAESRVNLQDSKGIVAELDMNFGKDEKYNFTTEVNGTTFVIKELVAKEETEEFKQAIDDFKKSINELEKTLYADEPNWDEISKLIDVDSFLKYYFLIELAEDPDRFITSTFFYKDGENDVIHIGPLWDNDRSYGHFTSKNVNEYVDFTLNMEKYRNNQKQDYYTQLYRNPEFVKLLNEMYQEKIYEVFKKSSSIVENYANSMQKSIEMNLIRWNSELNIEGYNQKVHKLKEFLKNRTEYLKERYSTESMVLYNTYIREGNIKESWKKNDNWQKTWNVDGKTSGIIEQYDTEMENIKIILANSKKGQNIKYDVHIKGQGWKGWKYGGSSFENKNEGNIDAIKIELEGMSEYKVEYRVYIRNIGWQEWKADGEIAGLIGGKMLVQAIEIKLIKK